MSSTPSDVWAIGAAYEPYIGRWSRLVAGQFVSWLNAPPDADWLDVGCGSGALTEAILASAVPARVYALDASAGFAAYARSRTQDARVSFAAADARALPCTSSSVDLIVSGLVINFVPQPEQALAEMARVGRRGATVAAYVWDYAGGMQLIRYFWDAARALDPSAAMVDEANRFPLCSPTALQALWNDAGFRDVTSASVEVPTPFRSFDDYWTPFLGGQGPAPSYAMRLDAEQRQRLRQRLESTLPVDVNGAIPLMARAWTVRGTRP